MRTNLSGLLRVTHRLRQSLVLAEAVTAVVRSEPEDHDCGPSRLLQRVRDGADTTAATHQFFYAGTVVSLYGALEQFVEHLVVDAARSLVEACPDYTTLPSKLLDQHTLLSTTVLTQLAEGRYHGELQIQGLVEGLHHVMTVSTPVKLNAGVFGYHTANLRWSVIRHLFERMELGVGKVETSDRLVEAMATHFPEEGKSTFVVDDLAQRRNEVSHGWESELLNPELLLAYIEVIEAFATALYEEVTSQVARFLVMHQGAELGRPDQVYRRFIAGYYSMPVEVRVGDLVAIIRSDGIKCATVLEMQQDGSSVEVAAEGASTGMKLSQTVTQRSRLYRLSEQARAWL